MGGSANASSDPYSIPWTDTQRMRNELDDLETQQNDLLVLNGGYMTTDILPQYRAYQDQIDQLNKKLAGADTSVQNVAAPMNTPGSSGRFATLGDAYVDFLEQEGVVFKDSAVNSASANGVNPSDPYSIPWTEDQEKRKRLHDAQIQCDNLLESMGDNPTMEDIIAWSQYNATIKQLTQELELGPKEYTPGVEGGYIGDGKGGYDSVQNVAAPMNTPVVGGSRQEEPESGPYTGGVEGADTFIDVINEYGKDEIGFDDMAKVLTSVYENPDDVAKTTKLKNKGYEEPKFGEGAAFVMDDKEKDKRKVQRNVVDTLKHITESNEIEDDTFKKDIQRVLDILEAGGISGDLGTYPIDLDGRTAEVEVLDTRRINRFGGDGTTDQEILEQGISTSLGPIGTVLEGLKFLGTTIDPDFNPGVLLEPGDVRIRIGATVESDLWGNSAGAGLDYFFRDGKFLYAKDFEHVVWGEYGNELINEYRSGERWEDLTKDAIKNVPYLDIIKYIK